MLYSRLILILIIILGVAFSGCFSLEDTGTIPNEKDNPDDTVIDEETVLEPGEYIQFGYTSVPSGKQIVGHMKVEDNETVDFYLFDTMGNYIRFTKGEIFYYNKEVSGEGISEKEFTVTANRSSPYIFIIDNTFSNKSKKIKLYITIQ